jgi:hypothetical protein
MARQVRPWQVKPNSHRARKAREAVQEPASAFHQGQRHHRTKVRMYGCNPWPVCRYTIECLANWGDHVCVNKNDAVLGFGDLGPPVKAIVVGLGKIAVLIVMDHNAIEHDVVRSTLLVSIVHHKCESAADGGFKA